MKRKKVRQVLICPRAGNPNSAQRNDAPYRTRFILRDRGVGKPLPKLSGIAASFTARTVLEQRLAIKPDDARTIAVLAQVDAGLGRKELAIKEAQHAVDLMPTSKDIYDGALVLEGLAQVYTWTNERDRAIELLQKLVTMPGYTNYARLKLHPIWNPLRGDPRFQKIVTSLAPKERH